MNEPRLIALEMKVSYQEQQIEELQKTVDEQYFVIEKMEKALKTVIDKMKIDDDSVNALHEKPPHY
jgi:SlyX protein